MVGSETARTRTHLELILDGVYCLEAIFLVIRSPLLQVTITLFCTHAHGPPVYNLSLATHRAIIIQKKYSYNIPAEATQSKVQVQKLPITS